MSNELISKIILTYSFSFWLLVLFSVVFLNCGGNIKVYFSIVTHEIPLRVRKKPRRTQCTIRSAVKHLQNLFNVKTVSLKLFKFYSRRKTTTITNFILDEIKRSISISVYYEWKRSIKNDCWREIDLKINFELQISYSPHSGTNTKIKWDMCLCILNIILKYAVGTCLWQPEPLNRNESGRFGALKSDSTHHFFRNACTKSGSLRFSQFGNFVITFIFYTESWH